jgi:hyperosmotically inducible periplasmic protein
MSLYKKISVEVLLLGACLCLGASMPAHSTRPDSQQPAADNTKMNKGDQKADAPTADHQKMNPADRDLTKKIRSAVNNDKSLSTYAHNIKIISQDGKVTLRGPVRSADEKASIVAKATEIAGGGNVADMLEVAVPQS